MKINDKQLGMPAELYKDTKSAIEALTGVGEGAVAYATDTNEFGSYDGATWTWGQGTPAPATTAVNDFQLGNGSGSWIKKTLAEVITVLRSLLDLVYSIKNHTHLQVILLGTALEDGTIAAGASNTAKPFRSGLGGTGFNVAIPISGTLKNLYFRTGGSQPASGSLTCTLNVNNSQKTVVATCPAGSAAGTFSDTTHSYAISAGDVVWFDLKNNATGTSAPMVSVVIVLEFSTGVDQ